MQSYQFTKKDHRKQGCTVIRCGEHMAVIYKHNGGWSYRVGFFGESEIIPVRQYSFNGGCSTKSAAIVQAEASIVGHGPNGRDYLDVSIEYVKGVK